MEDGESIRAAVVGVPRLSSPTEQSIKETRLSSILQTLQELHHQMDGDVYLQSSDDDDDSTTTTAGLTRPPPFGWRPSVRRWP